MKGLGIKEEELTQWIEDKKKEIEEGIDKCKTYLGTELKKIEFQLEELESKMKEKRGSIETLKVMIDKSIKSLEVYVKDKELNTKSIQVLDLVQKTVRESIKENFESVVTFALQYVLGEGYKFELEFSKRGNFTEAHTNIITPSDPEPSDPIDCDAGGCIDIVSLSLRVAMISLFKPKIEGPIILDESFKHTSEGLLDNAGQFLQALSKKISRQIIMVTHKKELINYADNVVRL